MCLAILFHRCLADAAVALAANREEAYDRPALPPHWWDGAGPVFAGRDRRAGGTWLGVNGGGLLVAITNRRAGAPAGPVRAARSRGLLCADALGRTAAAEAVGWLADHLGQEAYEPFNLLAADAASAHVAHWDRTLRTVALDPGIHLLADTEVDDPAHPRLARARALLAGHAAPAWAAARQVLPGLLADHGAGGAPTDAICRHLGRSGTVSSALVALPGPGGGPAGFLYAPGPPCRHPYEDLSRAFSAGLGARP